MRRPLAEIAAVFLKLGFTAFGGPAAHIGLMENECVSRRGWLDRRSFLDLFAALNFLPGPSSTQLAMALGYHRGGRPGLVVAGACFITPAMLIILPLGYLYVTYGQTPPALPMLDAIKCAIVAIIAAAAVKFGRTAAATPLTAAVAVLALGLSVVGTASGILQTDLVVLFTFATVGLLLHL